MKLPELKSSPMQRLALPDPGVAAAAANAARDAFRVVAEVSENRYKQDAADQVTRADTAAKERMLKVHEDSSSPYIPVDDPKLAGINYEESDVLTRPDGSKYVPTYKVLDQILTRDGEAVYKDLTAGITNDLALETFDKEWAALTLNSTKVGIAQIEKNRQAHLLQGYMESYDSAVAREDYAAAEDSLFAAYQSGTISGDNYSKLKANLSVTQETLNIAEVGLGDDVGAIEALADEISLDNEDYKGSLSRQKRLVESDKLEKKAVALRKEKARDIIGNEVARLAELELPEEPTQAAVQEMEREAAYLRDPAYEGPIEDPEQRLRLAKSLEAKAEQSHFSQQAIESAGEAEIVSDAWLDIKAPDGKLGEFDIEALFHSGTITGSTRTQMITTLQNKRQVGINNAALDNYIAGSIKNDIPLDPGNKDIRDRIDAIWSSRVANGEDGVEVGLNLMQTTQIMPEGIKGLIRSANRGNPEQLGSAAQLYNEGMRTARGSMDDLKGSDLVRDVAANIDLGMNPADAVQTVLDWENLSPARQDAVKNQLSLVEKNNPAVLKELITGEDGFDTPFYRYSLDPPPVMVAQFDRLVEQYAPGIGSIEGAQRKAMQQIKAEWSMTEVNGEYQYMRFAPANTQQVREDLDLAYGKGSQIVSDTRTELERQNGDAPTYMVVRRMGEQTSLPKDGWQDSFNAQMPYTVDAVGVESREEAQMLLDTQYEMGDVDLGRYTYDNVAAVDRQLEVAKKAYVKTRKDSERKLGMKDNLLDSRISRDASKGISLKEKDEYLSSEKGRAKLKTTINNLYASGEITRRETRRALARFKLGDISELPKEQQDMEFNF